MISGELSHDTEENLFIHLEHALFG